MEVPPEIDGPVLISDSDLAGIELGEGKLNPYEAFRHIRPTALIDGGVWVFDGHFKVPLASALVQTRKAQDLLAEGDATAALQVAEGAAALAPESTGVQETLGDVLVKLGRTQEARAHYEAALQSAETIEPALQADAVPGLKAKIATVGGG
jgi:tetratricopeptide (TPR) repeat protein